MNPQYESWHARAAQAALDALNSSQQRGLGQSEVGQRLQRHGRNLLPAPRRRGPWLRFLLQFHNVLIYVLLAAAGITALLGHWVDI